MSLYELKPKFRKKLFTLTKYLRYQNITPNQITLTAIFLSVFFGIGLLINPFFFLLFPLFVFIRMALNAIDGLMASEYNMKSHTGFILNEAGDIISDLALFIPFIFYTSLWLFIPFLCLTVITELIGILGIKFSQQRQYQGPLGKSDRVFIFSILALIIYFNNSLFGNIFIFIVINTLLIITIYNRWRANYV